MVILYNNDTMYNNDTAYDTKTNTFDENTQGSERKLVEREKNNNILDQPNTDGKNLKQSNNITSEETNFHPPIRTSYASDSDKQDNFYQFTR
jgi:hypothetical protein